MSRSTLASQSSHRAIMEGTPMRNDQGSQEMLLNTPKVNEPHRPPGIMPPRRSRKKVGEDVQPA